MYISVVAHRDQKCSAPGAGATGGCELSAMAPGNHTQTL